MTVVDVHNHAAPQALLDLLRTRPGYGAAGGDPLRTDPAAKLAQLTEKGIDAALVSILPTLHGYDLQPAAVEDVARTAKRRPAGLLCGRAGPAALDGTPAAGRAGPGARRARRRGPGRRRRRRGRHRGGPGSAGRWPAPRVLGSGMARSVRTIILPLLRVSLLSSAVLVFALSFRELGAVVFLTGPNTVLLPTLIFQQWETGQQLGPVAALNILSVVVSPGALLLGRLLLLRIGRRRRVPTPAAVR